jgi:hypothetical protein
MRFLSICFAAALSWATLLPMPAQAGPGHDHGPEPTASAASVPRVQAHSDLFELVGIVERGVMRIYLDKYQGNDPVTQARIDIEATRAGAAPLVLKAVASATPDGTFEWKSPELDKPGDWVLAFTIAAGDEVDLLSGELKLGEATGAGHADGMLAQWLHNAWLKWLGGLAVVGAAALALAAWLRRRKIAGATRSTLNSLAGVLAASAVGLALTTAAGSSWAHGDHGDAPATAGGNAPKRQADGSVFLPKPSQRQLEIRTQMAEATVALRVLELNARVVMDPNAGGRVQTVLGGRLEAAGTGLPTIGQVVRKGQVLAQVRPMVAPVEQANQATNAAEARINLDAAKKRLARLEQLEGSVPQRDVDNARAEVQALSERASLAQRSLAAVETLMSPVSGVVAALNVVAGQVVAPNEVLFEVVDPTRLMVEALAYDPAPVALIDKAIATTTGGVSVPLTLVGVGRVLREQALPVQFRVQAASQLASAAAGQPILALNQPLVVRAQLKPPTGAGKEAAEGGKSVVLPAAAVVKNPSNQDVVWVHTGAETFAPKVVRWQALDGNRIAVQQGLADGDRVVVRGASLLNQVR